MEPYDDDDDDGYNGDDDDFPDEKINFFGSQGPGPLARGPRRARPSGAMSPWFSFHRAPLPEYGLILGKESLQDR